MSKMKILIIILIAILLVLTILYFVVGNYFYEIALNPKSPKTFVLGEVEESEQQKENRIQTENWLDEISNDVYITTSNNGKLKLHAYEIINEKNTDIWSIVIHGYCSQGKDMTYYAKQYYNKGYNVLILDLRGHGKSEGDYIGMGWDDRLDIIAWANSIIKSNKNAEIVLHGTSMGSATVLMVSGEDLPSNIKAIVADCGYTSAWNEFVYQLNQLFGLKPLLDTNIFISKFLNF